MPQVSVRIPQMGEGLQEARLVEFLKQPGQTVRRDEPIYVMETDKAITEVESPFAGTLVSWLVEADSVLPIGTEIARMEVADADGAELPPGQAGYHAAGPSHGPVAAHHDGRREMATQGPTRRLATRGNLGVPIPPRTRKYLREKGLLAVAAEIPASGKKLLPEDIDAYLSQAAASRSDPSAPPAEFAPTADPSEYCEAPLPKTQQTLNYRMKRGAEACIPAVIDMDMEWTRIAAARERHRHESDESAFSMFVLCVVRAMKAHPLLRSRLSSDGKTLRTYRHVNIGVAVAVEDGLLRTAVLREADRLNRSSFATGLKRQVDLARAGSDQIDATTTVTVSNIGASGVRSGVPVIVTPAVATLALGQVRPYPFPLEGNGFQFRPLATVTMAFDHRVLNGVAAAEFLRDIQRLVQEFEQMGGTI